jgi:hypothetical protein
LGFLSTFYLGQLEFRADAIDDYADAGGVFYGVYGDYITFDVKVGQ